MADNAIRQGMLQALGAQSYELGQIHFKIGLTEYVGVIESVLLRETGPLYVSLVSLAKKIGNEWKYLKLAKVSDRQLKWDLDLLQEQTVSDRIIFFLGEANIGIKLVPSGHTSIIPLPARQAPTE